MASVSDFGGKIRMSPRSTIMRKLVLIAIRLAWLAVCLTALIGALRAYQGSSDCKMEEGLAFEMMVLSFPASLVVAVGLVLMGALLGIVGLALPASSKPEMTADWLLFVMAGYVQWFVILPKLLTERQKRRAARLPRSGF
jgi:hypothetical protein